MLKVEPQSPPINIAAAEEEQPLVWPWVGVLANVPIQWKNGLFVGPSGLILKQHLTQRGVNPLKVEILWGNRGHSGFALVEFEKDFNGYNHATFFDESFQASLCGKKDWNNAMVCPADKFKLYGWIAREDDYRFEGIVGQHLWKCRDLNKISYVRERMTLFSDIDTDIVSKRMHHNKMRSQVDGFDDLMKHKDEMVQCSHEALELRKGDHNLLVEKHQKEKEEFNRRSIAFEMDVDDKHVVELEIERMRGAFGIMRHMGNASDEELVIETMDIIQEQLKKKEEEYNNRFEAMNQTLIMKHQRNSDEFQGAGKDLIKYLKKGSRNISKGIKGEGDLDFQPFRAVPKRKYYEEKAYEKAMNL